MFVTIVHQYKYYVDNDQKHNHNYIVLYSMQLGSPAEQVSLSWLSTNSEEAYLSGSPRFESSQTLLFFPKCNNYKNPECTLRYTSEIIVRNGSLP
jgi:hypothetical protein